MVNNRHTVPPNRGASRHTIEKNTFAHRYKRMKKTIEGELDREDDIDKCTICLCEFEYEEHVRYVEPFSKTSYYSYILLSDDFLACTCSMSSALTNG